MSKKNGWVPIHKSLVYTLKNIDRPYSHVEAMFSHTVDVDCGREWTIKGYAKLWQWSRNKVRKFLADSRTPQGHPGDTLGTQKGHPIFFVDKGLWGEEDTQRTPEGHPEDTPRTPTINPIILNPKNNSANRFEEWWSFYPVKKDKKKAMAKWKSRNLDVIADTLIMDVQKRAAQDRQWLDGFIPHPTTYLNGDRWEDDLEGPKGQGQKIVKSDTKGRQYEF